eukprot:TRINITY_DN9923_c1_g1_i1.p1 TRINITY_DN9923_c1_g1~~TRINITY_DN9923_c1_g1_i1.p1  ORF type:complete len:140 (-),score=20.33 TRINITY_DN9923_c1_g1_i1:230-649(-)
MGDAMSGCTDQCDEECERDRKCYVDQDEVKICAWDIECYPQGSKGPGGRAMAELLPGGSSRSTAASSTRGRRQLQPSSVTWAEGLMRTTNSLFGRFQLIPKASSFSGNQTDRETGHAALSFQQQLNSVGHSSDRLHRPC